MKVFKIKFSTARIFPLVIFLSALIQIGCSNQRKYTEKELIAASECVAQKEEDAARLSDQVLAITDELQICSVLSKKFVVPPEEKLKNDSS